MRIATYTAAVVAVLLLSGCSSPMATPDTSPTPTETMEVPLAVEPPGPVPADVLLVLTATATASNGAEVALELRVRRTVPFDDVAAQTVTQAVTSACPDRVDASRIAQENWGFTRVNISAYPGENPTTDWPIDEAIAMLPEPDDLRPIATMSFAIDATEGDACGSPKIIPGPGKGAISIGIAQDTFETSGTTGWAQLIYGFRAPAGVTLTDCSGQLTELGASLGGSSKSWAPVSDPQTCTVG